jgi:hypothetical protein
MKKWLSFLTLAILPFANAQASALPNVLAGLDNASNLEVMNDQQLSEVRGTGNLPSYFAFREYYYNWNNYGSQNDFRSYIYDGGSTYYGGKDFGATTGSYTGEQWIVSINGDQRLAEQRIKYIEQIGTDENGLPVFGQMTAASWSDWNRGWDAKFRVFSNYNDYIY